MASMFRPCSTYSTVEYRPTNLSLQLLDVLGHLPADSIGASDVVHVRVFCSVVKEGYSSVLLKNVVAMLEYAAAFPMTRSLRCCSSSPKVPCWTDDPVTTEPGGWLQSDDYDPSTFDAHPPNALGSNKYSTELLRGWLAWCVQADLKSEYVFARFPDQSH